MADEKLNTGPGEEKIPEAPAPVTVDGPQAPAPEQTAAPTPQQEGPAQPEPGDVVVSFDKINELMNEKRQTARAEVEKEEAAKEPEEKTQEEPPAAGDDELKKARRGRPPKEEKAEPAGKEAAKPRKGRPPKADKAAPGEATPTKRDKICPEVQRVWGAPQQAFLRACGQQKFRSVATPELLAVCALPIHGAKKRRSRFLTFPPFPWLF